MKVLLDENLPHALRLELPGHDVFTAAYMGWSGIENGELLNRAADEGFDVLLSNDRGLAYEQDQGRLPLAVIVLQVKSNIIDAIRPLCPEILRVLDVLQPQTLVKVGSR